MDASTRLENRIDGAELVRALRAARTVGDDAELVSFKCRSIGIGHTADTLKVDLDWTVRGTGPRSLVAKVPSSDPQSARTARSLGAYQRECRFYAELAPRTELNVPHYYGAMLYDGEESGVLLENLSERFESGDQFSDSSVSFLRVMRQQLAALQSPFWDDSAVANTTWLHRRLGVPIPSILERMASSWHYARDHIAGDFEADERELIDRFVTHAGTWAEGLKGPFSLTHHDFRIDNMLFGDGRVVVLDWQTVGWGAPMFDVAYLLGTSVSPQTRRRIERDEVARHVDDLGASGVNWLLDDAWQAYRQASFAVLLMLVPPIGSVKRTDRGDAMYRRLLRHGARMALDLDAGEFLLGGVA